MKPRRPFIGFLAVAILGVGLAVAGIRLLNAPRAGEWSTDLDMAKERSAREGKPLLIQFTGDSWCPYCKALKARVLSSSTFAAFSRNVVMVYLDYPSAGDATPEELQANPGLAKLTEIKKAYNIDGFPTVILSDSKGLELSRIVGYGFDSPKNYLARLNLPPRIVGGGPPILPDTDRVR